MLRIKTQTDYYVTEVTFEAPVDLGEVETIIRRSKSNSKIVAIYNNGGVIGVSVEQKRRIPEDQRVSMREMIGLNSVII